jgi:hypothetical protein
MSVTGKCRFRPIAVVENATFPASILANLFAGVRATPYLSRPAIDRFMTGGKRTNAFANSFFLSAAVVVARRHMIEKTKRPLAGGAGAPSLVALPWSIASADLMGSEHREKATSRKSDLMMR